MVQVLRAQFIADAVRGVVYSVAPKSQKVARQHWIYVQSFQLIEVRDNVRRKIKNSGRMMKGWWLDPLGNIAIMSKAKKQRWLQCKISDDCDFIIF